MSKRVILITGTPAVGKTTIANKLAERLNAQYVSLTDLSEREHLALAQDKKRNTTIIDEAKMRRKIKNIIQESKKDLEIDGHYSAVVTPKAAVTHVFVFRRNPEELREFMKRRGYNEAKQEENLSAEILDVCLVEALQKQDKQRICELDITGKTLEDTLHEVQEVLEGKKPCYVGVVDWLGMLEREGKLNQYMKN